MASSIKLSVNFTKESSGELSKLGFALPWNDILKDYEFKCDTPPMIIDHLATFIENFVEGLYYDCGGKDQVQVQIYKIWQSLPKYDKELRVSDQVSEHLKSGDKILVAVQAMTVPKLMQQQMPEWTDQVLNGIRKTLRFGLNDRVLCYCGPRWLSGHIVGTAVPDDRDILPYLVKTDPLPGLPSRSISVPFDDDDTCTQEICFDPSTQLHLVKCAAAVISESTKPKLRFAIGDKVVCRIRNDPKDGLEQWVPGAVSLIWPELSRNEKWDMGGVVGTFPEFVPYKVDLTSGGWIYCHRDDHTLIRRPGMEPQTRARGISKRMELRKIEDGIQEKIDHLTERRKRLIVEESSDSE